MPQIIVAADRGAAFEQGAVTLREGVTAADFQSEHFATQLVERLGWAVEDADQLEQTPGEPADAAEETELVRHERREHRDRHEHSDRRERAVKRGPVTAR